MSSLNFECTNSVTIVEEKITLGSRVPRKGLSIRQKVSNTQSSPSPAKDVFKTSLGISLGKLNELKPSSDKKKALKLHKPYMRSKDAYLQFFKHLNIGALIILEFLIEFWKQLLIVLRKVTIIVAACYLVIKHKVKTSRFFAAKPQISLNTLAKLRTCYQNQEDNSRRRHTLVLDLDETLIHSTTTKKLDKNAESIYIEAFGRREVVFVQRRPHLAHFLQEMSKVFNLVVFTASHQQYADAVLDAIDEYKVIARRLYRDSCIKGPKGYVKELGLLNEDLSRIILIDNSEVAGAYNKENLLLIKPWYHCEKDSELLKLASKLKELEHETNDLRVVLKTLLSAL